MYVGIELSEAPIGAPLMLTQSPAEAGAAQRLASLGLRVGSSFTALSRTAGGGRVVLVSGTRIAVGASLLNQLRASVAA